jgi:hypothetical protein
VRGKLFVSPHAVERYQERVDSSLDHEQAIDAILADIEHASSTRQRGEMLEVTGARPRRVRYRIGPPEHRGGAPVVVTVVAR